MKKLVVVGLLALGVLAACGHKKASTTPSPSPDTQGAATTSTGAPMGGASYGGAAYGTPAK